MMPAMQPKQPKQEKRSYMFHLPPPISAIIDRLAEQNNLTRGEVIEQLVLDEHHREHSSGIQRKGKR